LQHFPSLPFRPGAAFAAGAPARTSEGLSPLIYHHVNPYGRIELDMAQRLALAA
jgi:hypothetical protein